MGASNRGHGKRHTYICTVCRKRMTRRESSAQRRCTECGGEMQRVAESRSRVQVSTRIEFEQFLALEHAADARALPLSELLRDLIEHGIQDLGAPR